MPSIGILQYYNYNHVSNTVIIITIPLTHQNILEMWHARHSVHSVEESRDPEHNRKWNPGNYVDNLGFIESSSFLTHLLGKLGFVSMLSLLN